MMLNEIQLLSMAFWQAVADTNEPIPADTLATMSADLQALAEDAVTYWLENGKAPLLAEGRGE